MAYDSFSVTFAIRGHHQSLRTFDTRADAESAYHDAIDTGVYDMVWLTGWYGVMQNRTIAETILKPSMDIAQRLAVAKERRSALGGT